MITAKITSFVLLVVLLFSRQSLALPADKSVDEFIKGNRMLDGMRSYGEDIDDNDDDDNDESVSIPPVSSEEDLNRKLAQNNPVADADDDHEDDEDDDAKDEIKVGTNVLQRADLPETTPIIPNPNPTGSVDDDDDDDDDDEDNEKAKAISNLLKKVPDIPTPVAAQYGDDDDNAKEEASELPDNLPICELDKAEFASDKPTVLCKRKTSPTRMTVRTGDNASSSFSSSTASNSITDDNGTSTVSASLLNLSDADDSTENDNGKEKSILVIRHQTQPSSNCDLSDPKPQGKTVVFTNINPTDSFTKVDSEMTCDDKCGDQINDQPQINASGLHDVIQRVLKDIRNPKESDDSDDLSTNLEKLFQNDEPSEARMCTTNPIVLSKQPKLAFHSLPDIAECDKPRLQSTCRWRLPREKKHSTLCRRGKLGVPRRRYPTTAWPSFVKVNFDEEPSCFSELNSCQPCGLSDLSVKTKQFS